MHRKQMTWLAGALGAMVVSSLAGCHKDSNGGLGSAAVSVKALSIADIASVTVVVQGGTMASPITVPLVQKGNQYSALVSSLPVGTNYTFTASAKDSSNAELYHGGVSNQTIVKNQTANIVINMNQVAPGVPLSNEAPVIDSLSATSLAVSQNDTVTIKASAHDPDAGDTAGMQWAWSTTCGPLGAPSITTGSDSLDGTSQIVWTAPAADGPCTVNVTVKDARNPLWLQTQASLTIQVNASAASGNAKITALPNTCPVISNLYGSPVPVTLAGPTTLTVAATDADGDSLNYHWTTPDCASNGTFATPNAAQPWIVTFTLTTPPPSGTCTFLVAVDDGTFPNGDPKCSLTNHLSLPASATTVAAAGAPIFGYDYQQQDTIKGGDNVGLAIVASQGCTGGTITLQWSDSDNTALTPSTPAALGLDGTLFTSAVIYPAQPGAEDGSVVTVTVTATCSTTGLSSSHQFTLVPLNSFCFGKADNTDCTPTASASNKCITGAKCMSGVCQIQTQVTCAASTDQCKDNTCAPATGLCALQNKPNNTVCSDGNACTTSDVCTAGLCGGTTKTCPAGNQCQVATCNTTSGACGLANAADGTTCNDGNLCTGATAPGDTCSAGVCGGAATACNPGFVCTPATGTCDPKICMNPTYAAKWVPPLSGLAVNAAGTPWTVGQIFNPFDFGAGTVQSSGSADIYMNKLDPATGLASASFTFGDTGGKDQSASGAAIASSGNVGLIGTFTGEIDFDANNSDGSGPSGTPGTAGLDFLQNASSIPFYGVIDGTSAGTFATPIKVHMVDVGTGALLGIGANPAVNAIAICGKTSKVVPNWSNTGATKGVIFPTGTAVAGGGMDIVVAKIDGTTGQVLWGKQFGGASDQICESVGIDSAGNVIIAGAYTGTLNFSATVTLPVVADTTLGLLYVAKLASADGTPMAAATWGTSGRSDAFGLTVDASNNIVVAGSLGANIDFGGGITITDTGLTDAFVVKLSSTLTPMWAKSFGDAGNDQTAKTVAVSSGGDVFFGGSFKGTLTGLGLTDSSNAALDAFTAQLAGQDGSVLCAHSYGDAPGAQAISFVTVARAATGALADSIMAGGAFSSQIQLGSTLLDTGSASLSASFVTRMVP